MSQCGVRGCDNFLDEDDDVGVCGSCGVRIARRYKDRILSEERHRNDESRAARMAAHRDRRERQVRSTPDLFASYEQPADTSWVYYVRIGDHIKIGYTISVKDRLRALRVPVEDLLALEPGGRAEEQARHERFAHLRITKRWENFEPGDALVEHIADLVARFGLPKWLQSPRRGKNGPVEIRRVG